VQSSQSSQSVFSMFSEIFRGSEQWSTCMRVWQRVNKYGGNI
jgi:hypothetical protein